MESGGLGFNLFGFFSGNFGLGVTARNYARLLREAGQRIWLVDVLADSGRSVRDASCPEGLHTLDEPAPYPVNLFFLNPGDLSRIIGVGAPAIRSWDRINACLSFWELGELPKESVEILESFDIVLAGSRFNYECYASELSGPLVRYWAHPLYIDEQAQPTRERWGLDPESVVLVTAFDMASDLNRKNPFGAIEAFRRAFPTRDDVRLVVKVNNAHLEESWQIHLEQLDQLANRDRRLILIDRSLPYAEVLSLYASCDVFVSLHRAEGLGLCLLELMSMGKPVIATAWSGNMEFMTDSNSCPVGFSYVPVRGATQEAYCGRNLARDSRWAEPALDEAASWMIRLVENPELRRRMGARAARDFEERQKRMSAEALLGAIGTYQVSRAEPGMDSALAALG